MYENFEPDYYDEEVNNVNNLKKDINKNNFDPIIGLLLFYLLYCGFIFVVRGIATGHTLSINEILKEQFLQFLIMYSFPLFIRMIYSKKPLNPINSLLLAFINILVVPILAAPRVAIWSPVVLSYNIVPFLISFCLLHYGYDKEEWKK